MRKLSLVAIMSLSFLMAGCKSDAETVISDMISKMNEITAVLKSITDANSSKAAAPKLKGLVDDLQKIKNKADTVKGTKAESDRLQAKYEKQLTDAMTAFQAESMRIATNPSLMTPELQGAFQSMSMLK